MSSRQIKIGALISYAAVGFNAVAGLLYTPWLISTVGASDYGLYTLAISVISFFMMDFGLGNSVSRFLSNYYARGEFNRARLFLGLVYKAYLVIDVIILAVLVGVFLNIDLIYGNLSSNQLETFKILYTIVGAYSVICFPFVSFDGIMTSKELFIELNSCNLANKVLIVALIVIALLQGYGVVALVAANAAANLITVVVKFVIIKKKAPVSPSFTSFDKILLKEVLGFSVWVLIIQLCQRFIFGVMPTILAVVCNAWEIALFGLASSIESYVYTAANAIGNLFMPKVSRIMNGTDEESLQSLMVRVGRIQVYVVGGIFLAFLSMGDIFVDCWVGAEYGMLYLCATLLIVPSVIELPQLIANTGILIGDQVRNKALIFVAMALVNVCLGCVLSYKFGAVGACLSICAAYLLRTVGLNMIYRFKMGIDLRAFFIGAYGQWIAPAAASSLAVWIFARYCNPCLGWAGFLLDAFLFCIVYGLLMWKVALDAYEKQLIKNLLKRV